jgi:hypothetical protein
MEATLPLSARWSHMIVREGVLTLDGIPMWDRDDNRMQVVNAADKRRRSRHTTTRAFWGKMEQHGSLQSSAVS